MDKATYDREIVELASSLDPADRRKFMDIYQNQTLNPVKMFGWNTWLGYFGVDRFIVGDVLLGILKLITLGGFGIWVIIDCFLIGNRTREKNIVKARLIHEAITERRDMGSLTS